MKTERMICHSAELETNGYPEDPYTGYADELNVGYVFYPTYTTKGLHTGRRVVEMDEQKTITIFDTPGKYVVGALYDITYNQEIETKQVPVITNVLEKIVPVDK